MRKTNRYCSVCGDLIFKGEIWERPGAGDEIKSEEVGKYINGAGECEECRRELCGYCGEFVDGICYECREKEDYS